MIPLTHTVTIKKAGVLDAWGILQSNGTEVINKARLKYSIDTRVAGKTTGQPVTNIIATGSVILELSSNITHDDLIVFTGKDGKIYEVGPNAIKPINDFNGKPLFWKVTF